MKELLVTNTFSPSMLKKDSNVNFQIISWDKAKEVLHGIVENGKPYKDLKSILSHQNTADFVSKRVNLLLPFNRENLEISENTDLLCFVPQIRLPEAKEFTDELIQNAPFKIFLIKIRIESKEQHTEPDWSQIEKNEL